MEIAVVTTDTGSLRVHGGKCRSVATDVRKFKSNGAMRFEADTLQDVALRVWGDAAKSNSADDATTAQIALELLKADDQVHTCLNGLPETAQSAELAYGTIASSTRNKHYLKADGSGFKTACGKAVKAIVREGEVTKRTMCTLCVKAMEQGAPVVHAEHIDWTGEAPRLARVEVPGLGRSVPVKPEATAKPAKPSPRQASAAASVTKAPQPKPEAAKPEAKAAKKTAAKAPKGSIGTAADLYAFVTVLFERKVIKPSMKGSHECAIRRVAAAYPGKMDTPVDGLTLDGMIEAFGAANPHLKPVSVKGYSREVERVLAHFTEYKADTAAWEKANPLPPAK